MSRAIERLKAMAGSHDSSMTEEDKYIIIKMRFDIEAVNMVSRSLSQKKNYFPSSDKIIWSTSSFPRWN